MKTPSGAPTDCQHLMQVLRGFVAGWILLGCAPGWAAPLRLERGTRLEVSLLCVLGEDSWSIGPKVLDLPPSQDVSEEVEIRWPDGMGPSRLGLFARADRPEPGGKHDVVLRTQLTLAGGRRIDAERDLHLEEGGSTLFEVFSERRRRVVLNVTAETSLRPVATPPQTAARAVRLELEVERVEGERIIPLESNVLQTFLGEPVEYRFRRGAGNGMESLQLVLIPRRAEGDLLEIDVAVDGQLPQGDQPLLLARRERLWTSPGASSSLMVAQGDPPRGYRFRITPRY